MFKKLLLVLILFFALCLVGCDKENPDDPNKDPNTGVVDEEFDKKFTAISEQLKQNIPFFVSEDIILPEEMPEYEATIEWTSSNEEALNFLGEVTVNRAKAEAVTLTYKVMIGDKSKEGTIDVVVSLDSFERLCDRFEKQFSIEITRDYEVKDKYYELIDIDWHSSNEEVFDNQGKYHKPTNDDVEFNIYYTVKCLDFVSEEKSITLTALGPSDLEKIEVIENWIQTEGLLDLYLTSETVLPTKYEPYGIDIRWECTNEDIVSKDGKITQYVFERYITLFAKFELPNGSGGLIEFECIVAPLDISTMSQKEIIENFLSAIAVTKYDRVVFNGNASGCNKSYGHLYFYLNQESEIIEKLLPESNRNRTGIECDVVYIVCHDTGNPNKGADAEANANYCYNSGATTSTGWHYTVGNDGIYQTIPEGEVGYHAHGGAYAYAEFIKTNVKAQWKKPNISLSDDGYIMFNNEKSNYRAPSPNSPLTSDGPVYQIGEDGYYYISKLWDGTEYDVNCVQGGNANSVGIESCVDAGSDYMLTSRIFAKLVAEIALRHDVDLLRVIQHNTSSGKDCPNGMRATDFWYTFKDMISLEIFAKTVLADYNFAWTGTGDIDNTGKIALGTKATEVNYSVVVTKGNETVLTKSFVTKINQ